MFCFPKWGINENGGNTTQIDKIFHIPSKENSHKTRFSTFCKIIVISVWLFSLLVSPFLHPGSPQWLQTTHIETNLHLKKIKIARLLHSWKSSHFKSNSSHTNRNCNILRNHPIFDFLSLHSFIRSAQYLKTTQIYKNFQILRNHPTLACLGFNQSGSKIHSLAKCSRLRVRFITAQPITQEESELNGHLNLGFATSSNY